MSVRRHGLRSTWIGRLIRGRQFDRNPLRRGSDRVETVLMAALFAVFLCGAWFAAHSAAAWSNAISMRELRAQQVWFHQVRATLEQTPVAVEANGGLSLALRAQARWTAPDGAARTGPVNAPATAHEGSTVQIWTDQTGQLVNPLQPGQIPARNDLAATVAVSLAAAVAVALAIVIRRALNRHRLAGWEADWLATGPRWTTRR